MNIAQGHKNISFFTAILGFYKDEILIFLRENGIVRLWLRLETYHGELHDNIPDKPAAHGSRIVHKRVVKL